MLLQLMNELQNKRDDVIERSSSLMQTPSGLKQTQLRHLNWCLEELRY